jgi:hypothetical protein
MQFAADLSARAAAEAVRSRIDWPPGAISGKFSVRKRATTSPSLARRDYIQKKQDVVLDVTASVWRAVIVLDRKTGSVTPEYSPS